MTSSINHNSQINENIIEDYLTTKQIFQRAPDTIEEEDDQFIFPTKTDDTPVNNRNIYT